MDFTLLLSLVSFLLERERRLSYRYIQKQFTLDDESLEELRYELVVGQRVAVDDNAEALIWIGAREGIIIHREDRGIRGIR